MTNLLSLRRDRFDPKQIRINDLIPKRSMGAPNGLYDLQNYVVGVSPAGPAFLRPMLRFSISSAVFGTSIIFQLWRASASATISREELGPHRSTSLPCRCHRNPCPPCLRHKVWDPLTAVLVLHANTAQMGPRRRKPDASYSALQL
jgi:hypothetical protein